MERKNTKVKIKEDSFIARLGAKKLKENRMALTLGNSIYLYNVSKEQFLQSKSWICHELKHVEQYQKLGLIRFLWKYLYLTLKHGYYNNPMEVEARQAENDAQLLARFKIQEDAATGVA